MNLGSYPPVDDPPSDTAWHEIDAVLEGLAQLAHSEVSPAELHGRILDRLVGLLSAAGGAVWKASPDQRPAIECQLHLDQALAGDAQELARHQRLAEATASNGQPRLVPPAYRDGQLANASPWLAILCPVRLEGRSSLVVEILQRPDGRTAVEEGYLRLVRTACELVEEYHLTRALQALREQQEELRSLLDFAGQIQQRLDLFSVSAAIANEARRILECDRVTVLSCLGGRPRVEAISGVESFDRRSGVVQALLPLAKSACVLDESLWLSDADDELPPQMAEQLQSYVDESHARGIGLVQLRKRPADDSESVGLLCLERFGKDFDEAARQRTEPLAKIATAALANALEYDRVPFRAWLQGAAAALGLAPGRRWSPALVAVASFLVTVAALWLIPAELTIEARGQLWPVRRQHVFAPSDSTVLELPLADGAKVNKGELLARLYSPQLDIAESELIGKQRTAQEDLLAAETESLRSERDGGQSQPRSHFISRALELREEIRGLEAQLKIVRKQQSQLEVKSPLEGVVITWDIERQLAGRPVKRGETLLTVADLAGQWEMVLDVADRRAGHVLAAHESRHDLPVTFQLGTDPGAVRRGTVTFVAPATELSPQTEPAVRVTASLADAPPAQLRPGVSVIGRIHCGRSSLGYVWLHEIWEAIRLRLFL